MKERLQHQDFTKFRLLDKRLLEKASVLLLKYILRIVMGTNHNLESLNHLTNQYHGVPSQIFARVMNLCNAYNFFLLAVGLKATALEEIHFQAFKVT